LTEGIQFKVMFKPKVSWADKIYFGNLLLEMLGTMAKNTSAFEFEIEATE
jgi:hypothetical protein